MPEAVAIVTARGGSKGLPGKNLYPVLGKPLIQYTLDAAVGSGLFSSIIVSSDDEKILTYAQQTPGVDSLPRPDHLARDDTSSDAVIEHVIACMDFADNTMIALLQPTSPLRTVKHLQESFTVFQSAPDNACVIGVYEIDSKLLNSYYSRPDGGLEPLMGVNSPYHRRQDLPSVFMPNGAIYWFYSNAFNQKKSIPKSQLMPYVMFKEDSTDIDMLTDIQQVEKTLVSSDR